MGGLSSFFSMTLPFGFFYAIINYHERYYTKFDRKRTNGNVYGSDQA